MDWQVDVQIMDRLIGRFNDGDGWRLIGMFSCRLNGKLIGRSIYRSSGRLSFGLRGRFNCKLMTEWVGD